MILGQHAVQQQGNNEAVDAKGFAATITTDLRSVPDERYGCAVERPE